MTSSTRWHITQHATNDEAYAILSQDSTWNSFALADLEPPLRQYSQFAIASQDESNERAICLILRHPIIGQVLSPFGSEQGVAAILQHLALPEGPLLQAQEIHIPAFQQYYQPETLWKSMLRMAIIPGSFQFSRQALHQLPRQLTPTDLPALKSLYAQYPESHFSADLFPSALYFGIYEGEHILAAAGTHALVPQHRIAVLGNVFTVPEVRGQGYATAVTAALIARLFELHFSLIVLNVFEENFDAIRIYQRLGFQTHSRFLTGKSLLL